ncbi:ABC transporter substrate-binding protein [uncultured Marinococcus sp.]|uniref:ABC transporter substrate-binding protein n=1 Tax=uncultured Marinococcus sp. TaxID=487012 RepID=UPI00262B94AA|nr:ABC transporter substrate-binding protein [uncultured Marinococcus sp.]
MVKKWISLFAVGFAFLFVLAACGNDSSGDSGGSEDSGENAEAETRTVTDPTGREVEIPSDPQNVVALQNVADMLILDEQPIGTSDYYLDTYGAQLEGVESVGGDTPNVEKINELEPDMILLSDYQSDSLDQLEQIAPVYMTAFGDTPEEQLQNTADALNKEDASEEWLNEYERQAEEARQTLADNDVPEDATAAVVQFIGKEVYVHDQSVFAGLYEGAGLEPTEGVTENTETQAISLETVPDYVEGADYLFVLTDQGEPTEQSQELVDDLLADTEAVQNEQFYYVNNTKWSDFTLLGREYQLNDSVEKITGE